MHGKQVIPVDVVQRVLQHFAFPIREGRERVALWAGSPLIPKPLLGAAQDSFSEEGSFGEAASAGTLGICRKGGSWRRKEHLS